MMSTPQLAGLSTIAIDPRGTGCNFYPRTLLRQLKLNNYVVYGTSYGTVLGTVLVSEIENDQTLPQPRALVIEGTLGAKIGSFENYYLSWVELWREYLQSNPEVEEALMTFVPQLGKSSDAWGTFIADAFALDFRPVEEKLRLLVELQRGTLDADRSAELIAWFTENVDEPYAFSTWSLTFAGSKRVENLIACREIASPWESRSFHLEAQMLVPRPVDGAPNIDFCGGRQVSHPYDASNYQLKSPVYYWQGDIDPQTPIASAQYHFQSQHFSKKKVFLTIKGAGHRPSRFADQLGQCIPQLWERVFALEDFAGLVNEEGRCIP